eukprot:TRINITY_DN40_c0_g1_i2.p1 TRINITY_DN40_c0_g1~~TRINITY_DN40_c0_g1_i2.p1  ORF type:complete len:398 (-),score=27.32 TRINITY_DN40_c0_g1_i2:85-1278(-)
MESEYKKSLEDFLTFYQLSVIKSCSIDMDFAKSIKVVKQDGEPLKLQECSIEIEDAPSMNTFSQSGVNQTRTLTLFDYLVSTSKEYKTAIHFCLEDEDVQRKKILFERKAGSDYEKIINFVLESKNSEHNKWRSPDKPDFKYQFLSSISRTMEVSPAPQSNLNKKKLVVFGRTGVGKSTLLNAIVGHNIFQNGSSSYSEGVTKNITSAKTILFGSSVEVFDTPGLGDLDVNPADLCIQLYKGLLNHKINKLLFVMRADTQKPDITDLFILKIMNLFVSRSQTVNPSAHLNIVLTHVDRVTPGLEKSRSENFRRALNDKLPNDFHLGNALYFSEKNPSLFLSELHQTLMDTSRDKLTFICPSMDNFKGLISEATGGLHGTPIVSPPVTNTSKRNCKLF